MAKRFLSLAWPSIARCQLAESNSTDQTACTSQSRTRCHRHRVCSRAPYPPGHTGDTGDWVTNVSRRGYRARFHFLNRRSQQHCGMRVKVIWQMHLISRGLYSGMQIVWLELTVMKQRGVLNTGLLKKSDEFIICIFQGVAFLRK